MCQLKFHLSISPIPIRRILWSVTLSRTHHCNRLMKYNFYFKEFMNLHINHTASSSFSHNRSIPQSSHLSFIVSPQLNVNSCTHFRVEIFYEMRRLKSDKIRGDCYGSKKEPWGSKRFGSVGSRVLRGVWRGCELRKECCRGYCGPTG